MTNVTECKSKARAGAASQCVKAEKSSYSITGAIQDYIYETMGIAWYCCFIICQMDVILFHPMFGTICSEVPKYKNPAKVLSKKLEPQPPPPSPPLA